jgi:hypothetical protein
LRRACWNCLLDLLRRAEGIDEQLLLAHRLLLGAIDIGLRGIDRILRLGDLGVLQRFA